MWPIYRKIVSFRGFVICVTFAADAIRQEVERLNFAVALPVLQRNLLSDQTKTRN